MKIQTSKLSYSLLIISYSLFCISCSSTKSISRQANKLLITDTAISKGFIGISVFDPSNNTYLYNYNADKYFVPASNTKLFTLYAGMKYLGDSLVGAEYQLFSDSAINVFGTGDPTFLHPDFKNQPVLDFLKTQNKKIFLSNYYHDKELGFGWAWDDYNETFMAERNEFPIYGNLMNIQIVDYKPGDNALDVKKWKVQPVYFKKFSDSALTSRRSQPLVFTELQKEGDSVALVKYLDGFIFRRQKNSNGLSLEFTGDVYNFSKQEIPFHTDGVKTAINILQKDFGLNIEEGDLKDGRVYYDVPKHLKVHEIYTQPSDSMFKLMMHRSDNFFAEQSLILIGRKLSFNSYSNFTSKLINKIIKDNCSDIPQNPKWVDGSGLSRYNLFTPQDFIYILNKMKNEFGMERMKTILVTGGEGTLKNYFLSDAGFVFAKTGTLSNNCALSGYIITKKNKLLLFSVIANNYQTGATPVRRAVEKFVKYVRNVY